jgi:hypothetical protein
VRGGADRRANTTLAGGGEEEIGRHVGLFGVVPQLNPKNAVWDRLVAGFPLPQHVAKHAPVKLCTGLDFVEFGIGDVEEPVVNGEDNFKISLAANTCTHEVS